MSGKWCRLNVSHLFIIVWLSLASFLHNILMNGANNVVISSLQKEFYLSSKETGVYVSVYDIGSLMSAVFIPFVSARHSKPKWIAFGMVMLFLGCVINVIPHFLRSSNSNLNLSDSSIELCNASVVTSFGKEKKVARSLSNYTNSFSGELNAKHSGAKSFFQLKHFLYAANMINGLSSASMTSLAFSYIEDIAPAGLSSIYESVYYVVGAFGVGVGFIITSKCLALHTDFNRGADNVLPDWLQPSHPNWIGAWWLPYIIFGLGSLLIAAVIFLFPSKIDSAGSTETSDHSLSASDELKPIKQKIPIISITNNEENLAEVENLTNDEVSAEKKYLHSNTLANALDITGSMLSMNHIGFYQSEHDNKNPEIKSIASHKLNQTEFKSLVKKAALLFKNPVYVFLVITAAIEGLLQNSFLAFAALFLEYQYRLASGTASFVLGLLSIPPLIIGGLLSGLIVKKFKNNTISCFKFLCVVLFVNLIVYAGFLIYCNEPTLILNKETGSQDTCFKTAKTCNCDTKIFKPVCLNGSLDIFFPSPCLAGCTGLNEGPKSSLLYTNCSQSQCDKYFGNQIDLDKRFFMDGLCPSNDCTQRLIVSYVCIFLLMFFNALIFLPYLKVIIGCVDSKEMNTIVLGLKQFFMNAFGTIPGPIIFGAVIDTTCKYWHLDLKNQKVCKMYNNRKFALGFGLLGIGFKSICFVLIVISLILTIRKSKKSRG